MCQKQSLITSKGTAKAEHNPQAETSLEARKSSNHWECRCIAQAKVA
jgi:hypothetical protein